MFVGFLAILATTKGQFVTASWLIILAAVFDMLDGKVARYTKSYSDFGVELDSLADVVSFGAAPAFLVYFAQLNDLGAIGTIVSVFPLVFGAIRLARFNVHLSSFEKGNFEGMPIPSQATCLASYMIFCDALWGGPRFLAVVFMLVIFLSVLMVSTVEFESMPKFSLHKGRKNTVLMSLLLLGLAIVAVEPSLTLFPLTLLFILIQLVRAIVRRLREEEDDTVADVRLLE
jgi:CDP-diacylglycerol--serine O-phosphatidyltransferase